mgnify:CR=1 FL=1
MKYLKLISFNVEKLKCGLGDKKELQEINYTPGNYSIPSFYAKSITKEPFDFKIEFFTVDDDCSFWAMWENHKEQREHHQHLDANPV